MAIRKITKKVITPVKPLDAKPKQDKPQKAPKVESLETSVDQVESEGDDKSTKMAKTKKVCSFCQAKTEPSYTDLATLKRFLTDRAKIVGKERSGVCSKHQRVISKHIKYARHLSLLPFVPKV